MTFIKYENLNQINNQISFRIGFRKELKLTDNLKKAKGFVLIDSPYNITFYSQTDTWCENYKIDSKIKTLLSGTIIQPYNNGFLQKKKCFIVNDRRIKTRNSLTIYKIKGIFKAIKRKK